MNCPMFSRILIKLIDQAIVPALLLLVTRIVTMIVFSRLMNATYQITGAGFLFDNHSDYLKVNSYSVLSMIVVLAFGVFYILLKSLVFHETHITPRLTTKLFTLRLSSFVQTSFDLYSQGAVWLAYIYFLFILTILLSFFGVVHAWVFFAALALTLGSTVAMVFDIEQELSMDDGTTEILEIEEDYVLKFDETNE